MAVLLGICAGLGLFLIWRSFWVVPGKESRKPRPDHIGALLRRAGLERISTPGFLLSCLALGAVTLLLVFVFSASLPIACCFALFGAYVPIAIVRWRAKRRAAVMRELWPDVVDHLRSAIRAGLSLAEALIQLGVKGPEPLRPFFRDFGADYRAGGQFDDALGRLKERLADPVADRIMVALRLTRDVGGSDLGRLLGTLGDFLREDARTRGELEARQSWTVNAARLAVAAPWVVLLLLTTQPLAISAYNSPAGWLLLLIGLAASAVCYRVMLRIGALPEEVRVLK
ncbi:type II secretion system F family protein [Psychromicrobium xiongbiense]|uniref:type II secretion system F family protein n=1 Tax=Psychromicrobium xiongbiense TaxID=3051184 RepID=UPI00255480B7|nr:type II secretion system F family protein [Psychromicrobium sp. YIM S02556]